MFSDHEGDASNTMMIKQIGHQNIRQSKILGTYTL